MQYLILLSTDITDYIPVMIQVIITVGAIFGGTGFWQWRQAKDQAKRDKESKESGIEKKVDVLSETLVTLTNKVDTISDNMQDLKGDIILLQQANEETKKYRTIRAHNDRVSSQAQQAIIQSLTGILRERLLEAYRNCMHKGYYSKEEREVYGEMFECYTQDPFNGNGVIHDLQPIMKKLPWTKADIKETK